MKVLLVLLLLLLWTAHSQYAGPTNTKLPTYEVLFNGKCRLCEIDCSQFIDSIFTSCKYKYYRYGCDAKFFCLATDDLRYYEKYVAVAFCRVENGCEYRADVNSTEALEDKLEIPNYLSYVSFYTQPSRERWMQFLAKRNAFVTKRSYQIIRQYPNATVDHQNRRNTYLRPLLLSYIHPGPGPLIRLKQGLDFFDMRSDSTATRTYVDRWADRTPDWFKLALKPITTKEEATIFQKEKSWMTKETTDINTPEFFFYMHSTAYLDYANEWAEKYRTFTKCDFKSKAVYEQCQLNVNPQSKKACTKQQMVDFCAGFLEDLGISWTIEDMRVFIEKTYYGKQLTFDAYKEPSRQQEIRSRQADLVKQQGEIADTVADAKVFLMGQMAFKPDQPKVTL